jgi:hypothetical protein
MNLAIFDPGHDHVKTIGAKIHGGNGVWKLAMKH